MSYKTASLPVPLLLFETFLTPITLEVSMYYVRHVHTRIRKHTWPVILTVFLKTNALIVKVRGSHAHC